MTALPERLENRVKDLLVIALARPEAERARFLAMECAGQEEVRAEVLALLAAHELAEGTFAPESPLVAEQAGDRIGNYRLLQKIGEGGFGVVWMADQEAPVRRKVALKVLKAGMDTSQVVGRFEAERQALALMEHENIAKVFDGGATERGRPYFVMELVNGVPITKYCDAAGLSPRERLELFVPVCAAVQHAHQKGVIHRDLKPSNVLVTLHDGNPVPKVIDFGIAKATAGTLTQKTVFTEFRQLLGTPEYMAPEQAELSGLDVDTRADVYSLGVLLYELLTGTRPFDLKTLLEAGYVEMLRTIREVDPPKPSTRVSTLGESLLDVAKHRRVHPRSLGAMFRGDLDWIVMRAMEKERGRRYATAAAMAEDVRRHLHHEPVSAGKPSWSYRLRKYVRRHWVGVAAGCTVVAALVVGMVVSLYGLQAALEQESIARGETLAAVLARRGEEEQRRAAELAREGEAKERLRAEQREREAKAQAGKARKVLDLLQAMLSSSDPHEAKGGNYPVRLLLDDFDKQLGEQLVSEPEVEADLRLTIGNCYLGLGLPKRAERHMTKALELRRQAFGGHSLATAEALQAQAMYQHAVADYAGAFATAQQALAVVEHLGDQGNDIAGDVLRWMADFSLHLDRFGDALSYGQRALALERDCHGEVHGDVAAAHCHLAQALRASQRLKEAKAEAERALTIDQAMLGADHPLVASRLLGLASIREDMGDSRGAAEDCRRALEICQSWLAADHPKTADAMVRLGRLVGGEDGAKFLRDSLAMVRKTLGPGSAREVACLHNLGLELLKLGQYEEAEKCVRDALALAKEVHGPIHSETATCLASLGQVLLETGRPAEAAPWFKEAQTMRRGLAIRTTESALAANNLSILLGELGDAVGSEAAARDAMDIFSTTAGNDSPHYARAVLNLSIALTRQSRFKEAELLLRDTELWRSDGTAAGTYLVKDLRPGTASSSPAVLGAVNGNLYFAADDGVVGRELFVTDGTAAGTVLVSDVYPGTTGTTPNSSNPANGLVLLNTCYFSATDGSTGTELWARTGTTTFLVKDINTSSTGASSSPANLRALGTRVVFTADDGTAGVEPWISDGTAAGTTLLNDINATASTSSSPSLLTVVGATVYFSANDGVTGAELWKTDGTSAGTVLVVDLAAGSTGSSPASLFAVGGSLFFVAGTPTAGRELHKSDGTAAGTVLIADLTAGTGSSSFPALAAVGSKLLFTFNDTINGSELWSSDGTAAGTAMLKDINVSAAGASSTPAIYSLMGGKLYFLANDGVVGNELWVSDTTQAGTVLVKDMALPQPSSSSPGFMFAFDDKVLFSANDGVNGTELWITDGTNAGTIMVKDINPGSAASSPFSLITFKGKAYFSAIVSTTGTGTGRELWVSDGTSAGTSLVKDINPGTGDSGPTFAVVLDDFFYFLAVEATTGQELWRSDGTAAGTTLVKDFYPGTSNGLLAFSNVLSVVGGKLIIAANDGTSGTELWISDGTPAGTTRLLDLKPGSGSGVYADMFTPLTTLAVGSTLYFAGDEGVNGTELWKTDGTAAGTVLVKDIVPGASGSVPNSLGTFQGKLFFRANGPGTGSEPWISDGTPGGTYLLKDITAGSSGSSPLGFFAASDRLIFLANDGTAGKATGYEPWITDGTTNGTQMVKDINPGPATSWQVFGPAGKGRRFAMVATDGANGFEHWISDGTAAGTVMLADLRPGPFSGAGLGWFFAGDSWYVVANDGSTGNELWVYKAKQTGVATVDNFGITCSGTNGRAPVISVVGAPVLGNLGFAARLDKARPASVAMLCVGAGRTDFPLGSCRFYPSLPGPVVMTTTDALGGTRVSVPLGLDPVLLGESAYFQWVVSDPNGAWLGTASLSEAMRVVIGSP